MPLCQFPLFDSTASNLANSRKPCFTCGAGAEAWHALQAAVRAMNSTSIDLGQEVEDVRFCCSFETVLL